LHLVAVVKQRKERVAHDELLPLRVELALE
jgi:hypothetical protein